MMLRGVVVLSVAILAAAAVSQGAASAPEAVTTSARDADACRALGFDADTLDCRRCDELAAFLHEKRLTTERSDAQTQSVAAIDADCRACCSDLSALHLAGGNAQYARVVLEVCTCKFGRYPKVANFVQHHASKHDKLEIKYINARHPFLLFYDADGTQREEVSIAGWDEDTISEFIVAKVAPSASSASDTLTGHASDEL